LPILLFLFRRLLFAFITLIIVITINFIIINMAPGDPVRFIAGDIAYASPEYIEFMRSKWGLDKPVYERLLVYISNLLKGDLGYSYRYLQPVPTLILERLPLTLFLTITSNVIAFLLGIVLGIISVMKFKSKLDTALTLSNMVLWSTPSFVLGIILMFVFSLKLKLFPASGIMDLRNPKEGIMLYLDILHHSILPIATLTLILLPLYYKVVRDSVLQLSAEDFVFALKAIGYTEFRIYRRHILRNAILPPLTVFMLHLGYSVAGATLIEIVFGWPGIGRLLLDAILTRDYPVIMGVYVVISASIIAVNMLTDILYTILDPRVRLK